MMKFCPLFNVLQAALWDKAFVKRYDTATICVILREAEKQTVAPLVFNSLVGAGMNLPSEVVLHRVGFQLQIEQRNALLNEHVASLAQLLKKFNIDYEIVKGQIAASYYPDPKLRQSGDVDFLCDENNYPKAVEALQMEWGVKIERGNGEFHASFYYQGVSFEIHHTLTHFYNKDKDTYWKNTLAETPHYTVKLNDCDVRTLHPTIHSLYIFLHLYHHLLELGVGLRQFCDWAMILHSSKDEIDHEAIKRHLKALGMEKAYKACGAILVRDLGLPADEFTYELSDKDMRYADRILDVIFYRGNMGHYNKRGGFHGWRHKLESTAIKLSHFVKFYPLAPTFMRDWGWSVVKSRL